ncbi:MAG: calcium/sodium antiporter [Acholeplasmataceae bacterium]
MQILLYSIVLIIGFIFLIKGADYFVDASSSIARRARISPLVIGLTLVAFGTSLPELAVSFAASITAAQQGLTADIALGNVVGSNIANITLILGTSALMMPILIKKSMNRSEFPFLIGITILIAVLASFFQSDLIITRFEAFILLICFAFYMFLMFKTSKNLEDYPIEIKQLPVKTAVILLILGLIGVSLGGFMVTRGAEFIATTLLVEGLNMTLTKATTLVGLSIVSLGTSLPELVTSVIAAKKGENEIAMGNVIGSNIFNTLLIIGLSGLVTPLGVNGDVRNDLWFVAILTVVVVLLSIHKQTLSKLKGGFLVFIYVAYITFIIIRALAVI